MQTVLKDYLHRLLTQEDAVVINVLPAAAFERRHIPNSINIPLHSGRDFVVRVMNNVQSKKQRIVLYGADKQCALSWHAAMKLEYAGFSDIRLYDDGTAGWFSPANDGSIFRRQQNPL